jgi:PEP-CTERM motif
MEVHMKKSFVAAALLAGLVGPVSAATTTLDFTSSGVNAASGPIAIGAGITYTVSGEPGVLVDSTHWNNNGCITGVWDFACDAAGDGYDVGFGVTGGLNNEIDTDSLGVSEYVVVKFTGMVEVLGFAGMLAYIGTGGIEDRVAALDGESVELDYSTDGGASWISGFSAPAVSPINGTFDSVGLAFLEGLSFMANAVRFTAGGTDDDGTINVTAAGLRITAVPVPASFPLLLAGLGALGFAARRKRRNAA